MYSWLLVALLSAGAPNSVTGEPFHNYFRAKTGVGVDDEWAIIDIEAGREVFRNVRLGLGASWFIDPWLCNVFGGNEAKCRGQRWQSDLVLEFELAQALRIDLLTGYFYRTAVDREYVSFSKVKNVTVKRTDSGPHVGVGVLWLFQWKSLSLGPELRYSALFPNPHYWPRGSLEEHTFFFEPRASLVFEFEP